MNEVRCAECNGLLWHGPDCSHIPRATEKAPAASPKVDGLYLMAWVSRELQGAGFEEEDSIAGLLVEVTVLAREAEDNGFLASLVEGAVRQIVAERKTLYAEPTPNSAAREKITCPVCSGTCEMRDAVQAWDEPDAPIPECPHCVNGVVDVLGLLVEVRALREALEEFTEADSEEVRGAAGDVMEVAHETRGSREDFESAKEKVGRLYAVADRIDTARTALAKPTTPTR